MYNCFSIANCIIDFYEQKQGKHVKILELLKHQFICYGWYWARMKKLLFKGKFFAYPVGPIMKELFDGFDYSYYNGSEIIKKHDKGNEEIDEDTRYIVEQTIGRHLNNGVLELSEIVHLHNSPWTKTIEEKGLYKEINDSLIKEYYENLLVQKRLC